MLNDAELEMLCSVHKHLPHLSHTGLCSHGRKNGHPPAPSSGSSYLGGDAEHKALTSWLCWTSLHASMCSSGCSQLGPRRLLNLGPCCDCGIELMGKRQCEEGARAKAEEQEVVAGIKALGKEAGIPALARKLVLSVIVTG